MADAEAAAGRRKVWLSIVVIGRNEGRWLPGLFRSLPAGEGVEIIFVDSLSTDDSVEIALRHGVRVLSLREHPSLCPASGRHVGTLEAAGEWILYLDGDMVLREEFKSFLARLKETDSLPPGTAGFVGRTCSFFYDSGYRITGSRDNVCLTARSALPGEPWGRPAGFHGGAVLYRREAVLRAGNWNPAVSQNEEIDLYSRVRAGGGHLRALDLPMADHYTPLLSVAEKLTGILRPRKKSGAKLHGAGQLLAARLKQGSLFSLFRYYPYPFVVFFGLLLVLPAFLLWKPLPLLINGGVAVWIAVQKRWYFYLVYLGTVIQAVSGVGTYRPFIPQYRVVKNSDPGNNKVLRGANGDAKD